MEVYKQNVTVFGGVRLLPMGHCADPVASTQNLRL